MIGRLCNAFTIIAVAFLIVIYSFPSSLPAETTSMNYTSVVLVGLTAIVGCSWMSIGKHFHGPNVDLAQLNLLLDSGGGK